MTSTFVENRYAVSAETGRIERIAFVLFALAHLIPIWAVKYLNLTDGGAHVYIANIMSLFNDPATPIYREYFNLNLALEPNWLIYGLLLAFNHLMSPEIAEKILVSLNIIGFPLAVRYAITVVNPRANFISWLCFPFIYSLPFNMGFYNFSLSLICFFLLLSVYLRNLGGFSTKSFIVFGLLGLLTYSAHVMSVSMFLIVIAVHAAWLTLHRFLTQTGSVRFRSGAALRTAFNSGVMPALALLPTLLLLGRFFIQHSGEEVNYTTSLLKRVGELVTIFPLMTDSVWQLVLSLVLLTGLIVLTGAVLLHRWRTRRLEQVDGLLLAAVAMAVSTLTVPDHSSGGGYIIERGQLYPYLILLPWLAHDVPVLVPRLGQRVGALAAVIAVGFIGIEFTTYRAIDRYSAEFWSGTDLIAPNSTVLGVSFVPRGQAPDGTMLSVRRLPVHHEIDRIAAKRRAVALNVWQFKTPNFPVSYRADRNPYVFIGDDVEWPTALSLKFESNKVAFRSLFGDNPDLYRKMFPANAKTPPEAQELNFDIADYGSRTNGGKIDYILLWTQPLDRIPADAQRILAEIEARYDLIHTSLSGYARLYHAKH